MKRIFLLCVFLVMGCSRQLPPLPNSVPISGDAYLGSQPLRNVRIKFIPKDTKCVEAFADTDNSGKFSATTYKTGDGIVPGEYTVLVDPFNYKHKSGSPIRNGNLRIPEKYLKGTSNYTVKISNSNQSLQIRLQ